MRDDTRGIPCVNIMGALDRGSHGLDYTRNNIQTYAARTHLASLQLRILQDAISGQACWCQSAMWRRIR
jgi:hypothetical protein